ncbi:MAG TPA: endonuclease [Xanthomonadaceae bacterium]|nr:endonuclease [Xanthomonadaceae bacterium]
MGGGRSLAWPLLAALCCGGAFADGARAADAVPDREMTLVTLNLHHDRDDWPGRARYIVQELKRLAPDVIALQEVIQRENLPNQAAWIAAQLGYDYEFASVDPLGAPKRYGNALLTRRPVLARQQRLLQPLDDYRIAALLRVDVDGQPVNVYVTHLNERADAHGSRTRRRQVDDLLDFIEATAGRQPVVIAGDFNSAANAIELEALQRGYGDSYGSVHRDTRISTLNMEMYRKPVRIDHVFFQQQRLLAREARIIFELPDGHGRWASDHYGVWTRLQFAPEPDGAGGR